MPKKSKPVENDPKAAWQNDAETLNYEEALQALDLLLAKLQDESPVSYTHLTLPTTVRV